MITMRYSTQISAGLFALALSLTSCTSKVNEGTESLTADSKASITESSIELLENKFIVDDGKPTCKPGNGLRFVVSQNSSAPLYCKDATDLSPDVQLGLICSGGVKIVAVTGDHQWRRCEDLRICGKTPSEVLPLSGRGASLMRQLHFNGLPWGCRGKILVSKTLGVEDPEGAMDIEVDTTPPPCPMCQAAGGPSCAACADDKTPPVITEVAMDVSVCKKIRFAVFAEDKETSLHPTPYSFDYGSTWTASSEIEFSGTSYNMASGRIKVRDLSGNVATFNEARNATGTSACQCRHGAILINNGGSQNVFAEASPACNVACRQGKVTCTDGALTGDVGSMETSCTPKTCGCTAPGGQTILPGEPRNLYSVSSMGCGQQAACDAVGNRIKVSCIDPSNNVMTIVEGTGNVSSFRASSCTAQACGCKHLGVEFTPADPPLQVFKRDRAISPEKCELTGMFGSVKCVAQGTGFRVTGDTNTTTFPYTSCVNAAPGKGAGSGDSDFVVGPGEGGGSGGGLGNDDGEGEGFRRRASGGGGGGGGCDINKPPYFCLGYGSVLKVDNTFCYLPKENGYVSIDKTNIAQRISPGGFVPAFSKATTVCGDSCSNYQGLIRCDAGVMSGKTEYPYLTCTEACP